MNEEKFTQSELRLLRSQIKSYEELHHGKREAANDVERRFVRVCLGLEEPITPDEKVYLKLIEIQKQPSAHRASYNGQGVYRERYWTGNSTDNWDYSAIK